ncbi:MULTISPECIES: hypothetical protein [unclassified Streptomyces]|uniref:hypothetical protein n=1 Tax=unclassified Streptomyces TaxID=2593676 RepID=UPI002E32BF57|nr:MULTISPECIES: hypothetical protein [unclassified Streptomyces]WUC63063.1 hypothetical protein OG861_01940 [Streptomyces sp. NBC_00539]
MTTAAQWASAAVLARARGGHRGRTAAGALLRAGGGLLVLAGVLLAAGVWRDLGYRLQSHAPNPSADPRRARTVRTVAALVCLAALAACGPQPAGTSGAPAPTARFTENGVTVTLTVSEWHASSGTLTAVFAPEGKGFHLYSTDLPPTGVEGVGRPTSVAVSGALVATGRLTAAAQVRSIAVAGVDAAVPVYPDGPVTTALPVRAAGDGSATVLLGYASCSTQEGCTIPVSDRPVRLHVTGDGAVFDAS